ncbi:glutathione S-transferase family protein [Marinobacter alexandrii]|uniref:glutathione S-transferase family protein n=1 Tax=Marinobacter alexandrii TaxID=2570351 RepID=UPI003298EC35
MKIYTFPVAPNPARVQFYLAEKGIAIEEVIINLPAGEQRSPEHLARNPKAGLPVLELDDGQYLTESLAIIEYLEELYPDPPLIGSTPEQRAFTRAMERSIELNIFARIVRYVHATNSPLGLPPNPALAENEMKFLAPNLEGLNSQLEGREFVLGDRVTIGDCTLLAGINFGRFGGWDIPADHTHTRLWFETFALRHL